LSNLLFGRKRKRKRRPKISLLIPFTSKDHKRIASLKWLLIYWKYELPDAEIVIGESYRSPFCKGEALNNAVKKSRGKVLVILDADAYLSGEVINHCADRILEEKEHHLWYVPYRRLYRLQEGITKRILHSDPRNPLKLPSPPPPEYVEGDGKHSKYGHRYGAMIMMFPREALDAIGGYFDERFQGWGGEDVALLRALDTLYGKHKTTRNDIYHLWHPVIGDSYKTRKWRDQKYSQVNSNLANAYNRATRRPTEMEALVLNGVKYTLKRRRWWRHPK